MAYIMCNKRLSSNWRVIKSFWFNFWQNYSFFNVSKFPSQGLLYLMLCVRVFVCKNEKKGFLLYFWQPPPTPPKTTTPYKLKTQTTLIHNAKQNQENVSTQVSSHYNIVGGWVVGEWVWVDGWLMNMVCVSCSLFTKKKKID